MRSVRLDSRASQRQGVESNRDGSVGEAPGTRTLNRLIKSQLLYQLS